MTAGSPDHHGLSLGYISEPQQIPPVFSFPPQVFFPAPFQIIPQNNSLSAHQHRIPLPPGIDSMAVHGVPGMYLSPQAWSKSTVRNPTLPSVIGPHYPLHHLTGSGFVLMQPSPCSDARISDLPDGTGQACTPKLVARQISWSKWISWAGEARGVQFVGLNYTFPHAGSSHPLRLIWTGVSLIIPVEAKQNGGILWENGAERDSIWRSKVSLSARQHR